MCEQRAALAIGSITGRSAGTGGCPTTMRAAALGCCTPALFSKWGEGNELAWGTPRLRWSLGVIQHASVPGNSST